MSGARMLKTEEVKRILAHLKTQNIRNYVAILLSVSVGTRATELITTTWKSIDGGYIHVKSLKNSTNTTFPISKELREGLRLLKQYYRDKGIEVDEHSYLFLSRKGKNQHITRQHLNLIIRNTCKQLGIFGNVSNHSFRKIFIQRIYELTGKDVFRTKIFSRHRNLNSLTHYLYTSHDTSIVSTLSWIKNDQN